MPAGASYMYGRALEPGPTGHIGCGLGQLPTSGTISLIAPTVDITHTDLDTHHRVTCRNGVVVQRTVAGPQEGADARYTLTKGELLPVLAGFATADPVEGTGDALATLQAHLDRVDPDFPIVTP